MQYRRALLVQDGAPLTRGYYIKRARANRIIEAGNSLADRSSAYFTLPTLAHRSTRVHVAHQLEIRYGACESAIGAGLPLAANISS